MGCWIFLSKTKLQIVMTLFISEKLYRWLYISLSSTLSIFNGKDIGLWLEHSNFESFLSISMTLLGFNINGKIPQEEERLKSSVNWNETPSINNLRILVGILFGPLTFKG